MKNKAENRGTDTIILTFRHARKHFSQAEGSQLDEVRQVMGMLAFPSDTHISPYKVCLLLSNLVEQMSRINCSFESVH